ncbi:MAG: aldehyde dehydrogenase family protein [Nitriliruptorales bacterium]|nr:aldehyde dehydrogenase family protein [Nitriliruptorales bacterium]
MSTVDEDLSVARTFSTHNPATGEVVGTYPVHGADDVDAAVAQARRAAGWWRGLGFDGRARRLRAFKAMLAKRQDELCDLIHRETGKPFDDARIELILAIDHLDWGARNAHKVLGRRRTRPSRYYLNHRASLEYLPMGVVGVIGPWNYPLHTPMGSITSALAAGNAVLFKPSEYTPACGEWIVDTFNEVVAEYPVMQLLTGDGSAGAALSRAKIDMLAFAGSAATGRKVMAACAESLTKVLMECGGNDAMVVAADADLDAAAAAAVWGGCSNAGQTCAGVERVYVEAAVYDAFVAKAVEAARQLKAGREDGDAFGPITLPSQIDIIEDHLLEALERGATAVVGGRESIRRPFVDPVVLVDVPEDTRLMRQETFGPLLPIVKVADLAEAVRRTNDTLYGLSAAVYAGEDAMSIARQLDVGMVSVNSVLTYAAVPSLPFGGRGESGFGRIHGEDGLREFSRPRAMTVKRFHVPADAARFDRHPRLLSLMASATRLIHGKST